MSVREPHSKRRNVHLGASLGLLALLGGLTGVPNTNSSTASASPHAAEFHGAVTGGRKPVAGAGVTSSASPPDVAAGMMAATAADGTFNTSFPLFPATGAVIFVSPDGGNSPGGDAASPGSAAIALTTIAGSFCSGGVGCPFSNTVSYSGSAGAASASLLLPATSLPIPTLGSPCQPSRWPFYKPETHSSGWRIAVICYTPDIKSIIMLDKAENGVYLAIYSHQREAMIRSQSVKKACAVLFLAVSLPAFATTAIAATHCQESNADLSLKAKGGDLKALAELRSVAEMGDAGAQRDLGELYATGRGVEQNDMRAVYWYRKAAQQGDVDAEFKLGRSYARARLGLPKDYVQAAAWLIVARFGSTGHRHGSSITLSELQTRMSTAQIAAAWNRVGLLYATGRARKSQQTRVDHWFRKAARAGNAEAQYTLGLRYEQGRGRVQSNALATRYFLDAAAHGEPRALHVLRSMARSGAAEAETALGWLYANGKGVGRDYKKAYYWWHAAAALNDPVAQVNLGSLYESGSGVNRDYGEAARWYRKAAGLRDTTAQVKLGDLYAEGHGVAQDYGAAAGWFKRAAGDGDAEALVKLGELYANGRGVNKNRARAAALFAKAAERGNGDGQEDLGSLLASGQGVAKNEEQAAVLFMLAKAGGNAKAPRSLARVRATLSPEQFSRAQRHADMWRTVTLVRRASHGDLTAFEDLREMARGGVAGAQVAVGTLYNAGVLMVRDFKEAAAWYRRAAEQGNANAYRNLAELYDKGQGVGKDHVKALQYFMLAAAHGNRRASAQAADLQWKMTPTEVAEAKRHAEGLEVAQAEP